METTRGGREGEESEDSNVKDSKGQAYEGEADQGKRT